MFKLAFILSLAMFNAVSVAQEVVDTVVDVSFEKKGLPGQKEVFEKAIEKISNQYIDQLIGESKAAKSQSVIKNRIIKNSGKYVMFIKAQSPTTTDQNIRYAVNMKISVKNLETLLLQEGLLYKTDGLPKLLPMIVFSDRINSQSFAWWNPNEASGHLAELAKQFHLGLRKELRSRGFFGLEPIGANSRFLLPAALQVENPGTEDLLLLAEFYRSQVVARGQIVVSPERTRSDVYRIEVRLAALHATNGRVIGEVIRTYLTDPGPFKQVVKVKLDSVMDKLAGDLSTQILDAWKSGTFGASLLNVAVIGDLSYQQLAQFKKLLMDQVKDLKTLKERLFEPRRIVFETDSAVSASELAASIRGQNFPRFQVSVTDVRPDTVDLKVVPR